MSNFSKRRHMRNYLASLISIERLGGTLEDAITLTKATMEKEDVLSVIAEFEKEKET